MLEHLKTSCKTTNREDRYVKLGNEHFKISAFLSCIGKVNFQVKCPTDSSCYLDLSYPNPRTQAPLASMVFCIPNTSLTYKPRNYSIPKRQQDSDLGALVEEVEVLSNGFAICHIRSFTLPPKLLQIAFVWEDFTRYMSEQPWSHG